MEKHLWRSICGEASVEKYLQCSADCTGIVGHAGDESTITSRLRALDAALNVAPLATTCA